METCLWSSSHRHQRHAQEEVAPVHATEGVKPDVAGSCCPCFVHLHLHRAPVVVVQYK